MKFQACIGPNLRVMHFRDTTNTAPMNGDLVLCEGAAIFADYRGGLDKTKACKKCLAKITTALGRDPIAVEIGVRWFA